MFDARRCVLLTALLCCVAVWLAGPAMAQDSPRQRLAALLARRATVILTTPAPTVAHLEMAMLLADQAVELDPTDVELRRLRLRVARAVDDVDTRRQATADLAQVAPDEQTVRLERINDALDRFQTVEERLDAYERLLRPENISRLHPSIASRLAFDCAKLYKSAGDQKSFAEWLGLATALDQTNVEVAAFSAGYFIVNESDPFARGELLLNLLIANPTDRTTQAALARHLLDFGAYRGAGPIYRLAIESYEALDDVAPNDFIADYALAQWGEGNVKRAMDTIEARRRLLNRIAQEMALREDPDLRPMQRIAILATLPPSLHVVLLAILDRSGDPQLEESLQVFIANTDKALTEQRSAEQRNDQAISEILLMKAWIQLWFGGDVESAQAAVDEAAELRELTDEARNRFDGLIALRRGDFDRAEQLLRPIAETDLTARAGLAMVHLARDDRREAARHLVVVARETPGTALGVWSRDLLGEIIGQQPPIEDVARRLNTIVDSVPPVVLRLATDPTRLISIRVTPAKDRFRAFEPVLLNIEVSNNSPIPLGLHERGPIRPFLLVEPRVTIAGAPRVRTLGTIVVGLDRRLRLEPFEKVELVVDLRRTAVGDMLDSAALGGATLEVEAFLNSRINYAGAYATGLLGSRRRSTPFRVDGARVSPEWVEEVVELIAQPDDPYNVVLMGLLVQAVARADQTADPRLAAALQDARTPLAEAYAALDAYGRAWILSMLPPTIESVEAIREHARSGSDPLVHMVYLLTQVSDVEDPMVLAAIRSEHATLRRVGELLQRIAKQVEAFETPQRDGTNDQRR